MKKLIIPMLTMLLTMGCTRMVRLNDASEYTADRYSPQYASGFRIKSRAGDTTSLMLEVYRPDTMRIVIPDGGFRSIMCLSSTYVGALGELGESARISAVSAKEFITDTLVRAHAADIGYDGAMNYEALLAVKPDIALIYGIGGTSPIAHKLDELNVPYVYINDFEEQDPLGRAEWIVALGALAGRSDASGRFGDVAAAYKAADDSVPVMINAPYSGSWFIPGSDSYMVRLLHDAGARLTAPVHDGVDSKPIDIEEALPALKKADIWLFPGQAATIAQVRQMVPKAQFDGRIWNQTPDFYESGATRPDLVLKELQAIIKGESPDSTRYFIRLK